jgi:hypothetical protein
MRIGVQEFDGLGTRLWASDILTILFSEVMNKHNIFFDDRMSDRGAGRLLILLANSKHDYEMQAR